MRSLNKYKITYNNQECLYVDAHDFEIVGNSVIFTKNKIIGSAFAAGAYKEKVLAISGASVTSIELIELDGCDK